MPSRDYPVIKLPEAGDIVMCDFPDDIDDTSSRLHTKPVVVLSTDLKDAQDRPVLLVAPLRYRSDADGFRDFDVVIPSGEPFIRPKRGFTDVVSMDDVAIFPMHSRYFMRPDKDLPRGPLSAIKVLEKFSKEFTDDLLRLAHNEEIDPGLAYFEEREVSTQMYKSPYPKPSNG